MKNNLKLIILAVVLALLIGGAAVLYNNFADDFDPYADLIDTSEETDEPVDTTQMGTEPAITDTVETAHAETSVPAELQIPDFTMYDLDGNEVKLSDFVGKPIIVNFWATWCGPCKNEMPYFQNMYDKYGDQVTFIMLNATDGARDTVEKVKKFVSDTGYTFPVYYDTEMSGIILYGVYAYPSTLIINADGTIYNGHVGGLTQSQLEYIINEVLKQVK